MSRIGERIKKARVERGLTQAEVGEKMGVKGANISVLERNKRIPSYGTLCRIASALDVSVAELIENDHEAICDESTEYEKEILSLFRTLNLHGKEKVMMYVKDLTMLEKYLKTRCR